MLKPIINSYKPPPITCYTFLLSDNLESCRADEYVQAHFSCKDGYTLSGTTAITCINGHWGPSKPVCIANGNSNNVCISWLAFNVIYFPE